MFYSFKIKHKSQEDLESNNGILTFIPLFKI